jgi:molecular chaperone GrpE
VPVRNPIFYFHHPLILIIAMIVPKSFIIFILSGLTASVDAFGVHTPVSRALAPSGSPIPTSTCLFAEEAAGETASSGETMESGEASPSSPEMDILNSPAFLKRKIEVLKSDIEATEKEAEEARANAEAGKAEWGPQLDSLRAEVSSACFFLKS